MTELAKPDGAFWADWQGTYYNSQQLIALLTMEDMLVKLSIMAEHSYFYMLIRSYNC